jgi:hypothetical protein
VYEHIGFVRAGHNSAGPVENLELLEKGGARATRCRQGGRTRMGLLVVTKRPFSIEGPHWLVTDPDSPRVSGARQSPIGAAAGLSDASFSPRSPVPRRLRASPTCQSARPMPAPARASSRLSARLARPLRSRAEAVRRNAAEVHGAVEHGDHSVAVDGKMERSFLTHGRWRLS